MARKILFTAERLRKKLIEMQRGGYKLRQDSVICGDGEYFSTADRDTLLSLGVDSGWVEHSISRVVMYFYRDLECKWLVIEAHSSGVARLFVEGIPFRPELVREDVEYVIGVGDSEEEEIERHLVLGESPIFRDLLQDYGLLPDSLVLWEVFCAFIGESFEFGKICRIPQRVLEEVTERLLHLGFAEKPNGVYERETYWVSISLRKGIELQYHDKYMSGVSGDYRMEVASELGISDFSTRYFNDWSYRLKMVDGDINDSVFKFNRVNLEDLLRKLHEDNYTLDSIGVVNVRSWEDCVTVCGFKNVNDYAYIIFYFDKDRKDFLVEIVSSESEVREVMVEDVKVPLVHVSVGGFRELSTFIHGFDLGNFREHSLV